MQKMIIGFEGTPVVVRLVPHKTSDACAVLKAKDPIVGSALCLALGLEPLELIAGSNFFLTVVDKVAFFAKLPQLATLTIDALQQAVQKVSAEAMHEACEDSPEAATEMAQKIPTVAGLFALPAPKAGKCGDCGCENGEHWNFCSMNKH